MNSIYLLYGESVKEIINRRKKIIEEAQVDDFNVSIFDMDSTSIDKALEDAYTIPFLGDNRCVVLTNAIFLSTSKERDENGDTKQGKRDMTPLVEYISAPVLTTVLIIECPKSNLDNKNPAVKLLVENKLTEPFPLASKEKITKYIDEKLSEANHHIDSDARSELIKRLESDELGYQNEIEKLLLYLSDGEDVTLPLVKVLITDSENENIYSLMNAFSEGNKKRALEVYYNLIDQGLDPIYIVSSMVKRFTQLLYAKELLLQRGTKEDIQETLNVSSGQAYYILKEARSMDYHKLSNVLNDLKELDYSSKVDYKYGNDNVIGFELFLLK